MELQLELGASWPSDFGKITLWGSSFLSVTLGAVLRSSPPRGLLCSEGLGSGLRWGGDLPFCSECLRVTH